MKNDSYNKFATAVKTEIQELNYEQQLNILSIVIAAMSKNSPSNFSSISEQIMSQKEKMDLFEKFNGSLKVSDNFNEKEEYIKYLDERYN